MISPKTESGAGRGGEAKAGAPVAAPRFSGLAHGVSGWQAKVAPPRVVAALPTPVLRRRPGPTRPSPGHTEARQEHSRCFVSGAPPRTRPTLRAPRVCLAKATKHTPRRRQCRHTPTVLLYVPREGRGRRACAPAGTLASRSASWTKSSPALRLRRHSSCQGSGTSSPGAGAAIGGATRGRRCTKPRLKASAEEREGLRRCAPRPPAPRRAALSGGGSLTRGACGVGKERGGRERAPRRAKVMTGWARRVTVSSCFLQRASVLMAFSLAHLTGRRQVNRA